MHDNVTGVADENSSTSILLAGDSSTLLEKTTTTLPSVHHDFYDTPKQRYDEEGTVHLVAVVSSVIVFIGMIFTVKSIISFIRTPRRPNNNTCSGIRPGPSFLHWLADEPPPYPGKYSRTNVNYLPSYESAIEINRRLQWVRDAAEVARAKEEEVDQKALTSEVTSESGNDVVVFMVGGDLETSQENFVNYDIDRQVSTVHPPTDTSIDIERGEGMTVESDLQGATGSLSLNSEADNVGEIVNDLDVPNNQSRL
ncbi:uncharacterized protein LOC133178535 [Saccostrea echinata]|uniref:uncharacterized protein LOC133178535 n=1 Tax=Saccostrea echinata TaxID=191078 RepID=UPI002A80BF35|nr:uncharacterized protein LOC133178535 [Saccostrea echinata]